MGSKQLQLTGMKVGSRGAAGRAPVATAGAPLDLLDQTVSPEMQQLMRVRATDLLRQRALGRGGTPEQYGSSGRVEEWRTMVAQARGLASVAAQHRYQKFMKEAEALPPGDPRRAALEAEAHRPQGVWMPGLSGEGAFAIYDPKTGATSLEPESELLKKMMDSGQYRSSDLALAHLNHLKERSAQEDHPAMQEGIARAMNQGGDPTVHAHNALLERYGQRVPGGGPSPAPSGSPAAMPPPTSPSSPRPATQQAAQAMAAGAMTPEQLQAMRAATASLGQAAVGAPPQPQTYSQQVAQAMAAKPSSTNIPIGGAAGLGMLAPPGSQTTPATPPNVSRPFSMEGVPNLMGPRQGSNALYMAGGQAQQPQMPSALGSKMAVPNTGVPGAPIFPQATSGPLQESAPAWFAAQAAKTGINPNIDDPGHKYDNRAAYAAGAEPGADGHWPSTFKADDHPNRFIPQPGGGTLDSRNGYMMDPGAAVTGPRDPNDIRAVAEEVRRKRLAEQYGLEM